MRTLCLLFSVLLLAPSLSLAEEAPTGAPSDLALRLAESERRHAELLERQQAQEAQLNRLRQENQRLRLQHEQAPTGQSPQWLDERQQWFAIGGALALLGVILGALLRGRGKSRREWLN